MWASCEAAWRSLTPAVCSTVSRTGLCLQELVGKFIPEAIGKEIEKACQGIYPLQNTFVRKVKLLRAPKFDINKLMEVRVVGWVGKEWVGPATHAAAPHSCCCHRAVVPAHLCFGRRCCAACYPK